MTMPTLLGGVSVSVGGTSATLVVLIVALRIGLANLAPISDCDEVYNYWEPVHFLRFGTSVNCKMPRSLDLTCIC